MISQHCGSGYLLYINIIIDINILLNVRNPKIRKIH